MKLNEFIELNGIEYTLELNRDSFIQLDKICNIALCMKIINNGIYDYVDEIDDNYNPLENIPTEEEIKSNAKVLEQTLSKLIERAFFIWLYPNHKLTITQVKEIINPYLEDETKANFIVNKTIELLQKCVEVRDNTTNDDEKNLQALANQ